MDVIISVENFEEDGGNYRNINSPRTLESCLRSGLDPTELYPKPKNFYVEKGMTKEMVDIKYNVFEKKRQDKIEMVKKERDLIVQYSERKNVTMGATSPKHGNLEQTDAEKASALLEMEEKRMEALRRRQEKELAKIVEREQTMAVLQQKIKRTEEEEQKRKKLHDKKVAELKIEEQKKQKQREKDLKQLEEEEAQRKREIARRDAAIAEKLKKKQLQQEQQILKEARLRDEERRRKIEDNRQKTEEMIKAQEDMAERNRAKMIEREERIMTQLEEKKEQKRIELQISREKASKRIEEALHKYHEVFAKRREDFDRSQSEAAELAKQHELAERERLKKQAEDRERRNNQRLNRLVEAYRYRNEKRKNIVDRRMDKESVFQDVQKERDYRTSMLKFSTTLKLQDKQENVERVARQNEFHRLQIMKKIEQEDLNFEEIQVRKEEMLRKHRDEMKTSLIRKHEISDVMDQMRMTNDFSLMDKMFAQKRKNTRRATTSGKADDGEGDDRFAQTI